MKQILFVIFATLMLTASLCVASSTTPSSSIPKSQLTFTPGDGNPPPTCVPGKPCDDKDYVAPRLACWRWESSADVRPWEALR